MNERVFILDAMMKDLEKVKQFDFDNATDKEMDEFQQMMKKKLEEYEKVQKQVKDLKDQLQQGKEKR